ncbi:hypothetical protein Nepgr_006539, partial [Nepenthes gracilis]
RRLTMSMVKGLLKINQGGEWISLVPRSGLKVNTAIYGLLKNWKNQFFFVRVTKTWSLAKDWGQVLKVYTGMPSLEWLTKLVKAYIFDFKRDFLVFRVETKKVNWGPPFPI